jgi:hypothetical protein
MAQLQKGTTYTGTGVSSFVTHTNLNAHVDNARLVGGAIDEQVQNSVTTDNDLILINKGGDLFKQTKGQFTETINSNSISVNELSVVTNSTDTIDTDVIEMTGTTTESYIDLNNASIFSSNKTNYNINFGFGATSLFPAPTGWTSPTTYNFFGGVTNFIKGTNVATDEGHDVNIDGNVEVSGTITSNGKPVMTGTAVAMKSGQCGIFGTTVLHKTGLLDIPADETWIITFLAHWTTGQSGNTRPDGYYTVTASVEKDTYSDVTVGSWTKVFPPYAGLCFINTTIKLTRGDLANMTKRLKFTANWGVTSSSTSGYSILLTKVKTEAFDLDSSIL